MLPGSPRMKNSLIVVSSLLLAAAALTNAQEAKKSSAASGVFTAAQAQRGKVEYAPSCASCHGIALVPSNADVPGLSGVPFEFSWHGQTLAERFERISTTMPYNAPKSLTSQQYVEILAYILQFNGYPAGNTELPADMTALQQIVIEPLAK